MSITLSPLSKLDANYSEVIDLYKSAFPEAQHIPAWFLRYKLRNGKQGFSTLYSNETWVGLIYFTEYKDIIFVQFIAISAACRSNGYGSQVMDELKQTYPQKRIVLNIQPLDEHANNYQQRLKRRAFYQKNGFDSSGFIVKEPGEKLEMLIYGGSISKDEVDDMYSHLFGSILSRFVKPQVIKI
ncbi:GNAT family N-acetyltransferase [Thalassotalea sp. HSM 43]|uniref:GNAT family N-acetyltransferase n=1 Tax=Thalassotalea sp. HSM 43 TaxID=2552945 RepID=UPI0010818309|nr:GNAT family N-acetyltransferase [Thalassotalea sp. HSM 43]QBY05372.1 GNAT family N-acetyltransferase [Thalassotalea sp. HSM 43]